MSPSEIFQFAGQIEKLGIVGLMAIAAGVEAWALARYRKELIRTYRQRDRARAIQFAYKTALDNAGIKIDISDIEKTFDDDRVEAKGD